MNKKITINGTDIYVGSFQALDARMYIILQEEQALIVDPCLDWEALELLKGVTQVTILLTHEHYDHISGVCWLQQHYDCRVICTELCGEQIQSPEKNAAKYFQIMLEGKSGDRAGQELAQWDSEYACTADVVFHTEYDFCWKQHRICLKEAPGHSPGGMLIYLDEAMVFTGDNLVNGNKVITRGLGGNRTQYMQITYPLLKKLKSDMWILPGHGEVGQFSELSRYMIE